MASPGTDAPAGRLLRSLAYKCALLLPHETRDSGSEIAPLAQVKVHPAERKTTRLRRPRVWARCAGHPVSETSGTEIKRRREALNN